MDEKSSEARDGSDDTLSYRNKQQCVTLTQNVSMHSVQ